MARQHAQPGVPEAGQRSLSRLPPKGGSVEAAMPVFSKSIVRIDHEGNVTVDGALEPYQSRIRHFVNEEHIIDTSIRLRGGCVLLSGNITPDASRKVARFISAECPLPGSNGELTPRQLTSFAELGLRPIKHGGHDMVQRKDDTRPRGLTTMIGIRRKIISSSALGVYVSDDDDALGFWVHGGAYMTFAPSFNMGLDIRYSQAEVTMFGLDGEAGGVHGGLVLGYHW